MISFKVPAIKEIEKIAQGRKGCISFSQGALRLGGVHPDIKNYARQMSQSDKADYYQDALGILPLRNKIAKMLSESYETNVGIDQIAITHGAIGALTSICLTILKTGDEVLLPEPTYPVYQHAVTLAKGKPISIQGWHMIPAEKGTFTWQFDLKAIENAITVQTRMIIFSNPSNPLGCYLSKAELITLAKLCESKGIYLVIDEIYDDFIFEGTFYSSSSLALESDRVIRIGSFSKNFGMSGWRIGYVISSKRLTAALGSIQMVTLNCPNVISQYAAWFGLEHKEEIITPYYEKVHQARKIICEFFDFLQIQGEFQYVKPDAGFYIFFKTKEPVSTSFVIDLLDKANIALVPGTDFGSSCGSFVRLCFAREIDLVTEGIRRFQDYLTQKKRIQNITTL